MGAEGFTEQYVLSRILRGQITRTTGLSVNLVDSLGTLVAFDALRTNQIDVWVAYSGNLWTLVPLHGEQPRDRDDPAPRRAEGALGAVRHRPRGRARLREPLRPLDAPGRRGARRAAHGERSPPPRRHAPPRRGHRALPPPGVGRLRARLRAHLPRAPQHGSLADVRGREERRRGRHHGLQHRPARRRVRSGAARGRQARLPPLRRR